MPFSEGSEYDEDGSDALSRPAPDPDDRLWRHPSELPAHPSVRGFSPIGTRRRHGHRRYAGPGRQLVGAAIVAGVAGAAVVLAFNGLMTQHRAGSVGLASSGPTTSETSPAAYITGTTGAGSPSPAIAVGSGVSEMINGLLPGIVAVDVAGTGRDQQGTGLVVRSDGMILTTSSLVSNATTITVTSSDGQEWNASLVGTDPTTGAAVISVPASGLTVLPVDSEADVQTGQLSVVICANSRAGGPFQASVGLFSGVDQQIDLDSGISLLDAIVTDSAPPNATGGFIFDDQGGVVGIVQSVLTAGGTTQGVARPIGTVRDAADSLIAGQEVLHGWLGVVGTDGGGGALVEEVDPSSPAAEAGIRPGDILTSIDNQPIPSMIALSADVSSLQPGETVLLGLDRDGSPRDVAATLDGQPGSGS